jgi:hypothetical protein
MHQTKKPQPGVLPKLVLQGGPIKLVSVKQPKERKSPKA